MLVIGVNCLLEGSGSLQCVERVSVSNTYTLDPIFGSDTEVSNVRSTERGDGDSLPTIPDSLSGCSVPM